MTAILDPASREHTDQLVSTKGRVAQRVWSTDMPIALRNKLIGICQSHAREQCGFISSDWSMYEVRNDHGEPYHNFYMEPRAAEEVLREIYEQRCLTVLGIWHTHPNDVPWPSPRDILGWPDLKLKWRYFVVTNDEVLEWGLT